LRLARIARGDRLWFVQVEDIQVVNELDFVLGEVEVTQVAIVRLMNSRRFTIFSLWLPGNVVTNFSLPPVQAMC